MSTRNKTYVVQPDGRETEAVAGVRQQITIRINAQQDYEICGSLSDTTSTPVLEDIAFLLFRSEQSRIYHALQYQPSSGGPPAKP